MTLEQCILKMIKQLIKNHDLQENWGNNKKENVFYSTRIEVNSSILLCPGTYRPNLAVGFIISSRNLTNSPRKHIIKIKLSF